jgi:HAE1 family hydrophobic/amphiphilic exporter-1
VYSANQDADIALAYTTYRANVPQIFVDLDREKAKTLGVDVADVFSTLQAYLGSYYINDFNLFGRVYKVMIQAEGDYRNRVEDIGNLYVRAGDGTMVPMQSLVTTKNVLRAADTDPVQHVPLRVRDGGSGRPARPLAS